MTLPRTKDQSPSCETHVPVSTDKETRSTSQVLRGLVTPGRTRMSALTRRSEMTKQDPQPPKAIDDLRNPPVNGGYIYEPHPHEPEESTAPIPLTYQAVKDPPLS